MADTQVIEEGPAGCVGALATKTTPLPLWLMGKGFKIHMKCTNTSVRCNQLLERKCPQKPPTWARVGGLLSAARCHPRTVPSVCAESTAPMRILWCGRV